MFKFSVKADTLEELCEKVRTGYIDLVGTDVDEPSVTLEWGNPFDFDQAVEETQLEPAPAVEASAPIPEPVAQPVLAEASEVDSKGNKWDASIHAVSKRFNKDGTWTNKRGINLPTQPTVAAPVFQPAVPVPNVVAPQATPALPATPLAPIAVAQVVSSASSYENIPVPEGVKPAHSLATFKANLIPCLATLVKEKKIQQGYIEQLKTYFGVADIWKVNEQQLGEMFEQFCGLGLITKVE